MGTGSFSLIYQIHVVKEFFLFPTIQMLLPRFIKFLLL
jgi:hypothetical protein